MFCSWRARQAGDQLIGTAAEAPAWLLVEDPSAWGPKAVADSDLPGAAKTAIDDWTAAVDGLRVQLIRRAVNEPDVDGATTVYLARPHPQHPRLYRARLPDPAALPDLDVPALIGSDDPPADPGDPSGLVEAVDERLVLTCTNGKRDKCCARYGNALHDAFRDVDAAAAWQTSHLGGHRFAPTCVLLPCGSHYGWLSTDDVGALWTAHDRGHLYRLDRYRGHAGYPRPVQAGALFLRQVLERTAVEDLAFADAEESGGVWRVRFCVDEERHEIKLDVVEGETIPLSCGADPEPTHHFRLEGHRTL